MSITTKAFGKLLARAQRSDAALTIQNHANGSERLVITRGPLRREFKTDVSGIVGINRLLAVLEAEVAL